MHDTIVLGLGVMGAAAAAELAGRGRRVLGLDQFGPVHDRGSSHGHTRIIRRAYYEDPVYVPLVEQSFAGWHRLEQRTGRHLLTGCPCLTVGPPGGELVTGVGRSAAEHNLPVESLTADEVNCRFPAFAVPDSLCGLLEHTAGVLYAEESVRALHAAATADGADLRFNEAVRGWRTDGTGVEVRTDAGVYHAGGLVLAAGPWAGKLLADAGVPLTVMRQVQLWFQPSQPELFRRDRFPVYLLDTPDGAFYGLPMLDGRGHKAAQHYGGDVAFTPEELDPAVRPADEGPLRLFFRNYLPAGDGPLGAAAVCRYTLSPDKHFVLDRHPAHPQVAVAGGFSGHGFKFAPAVGTAMADLLDGVSRPDLDRFRAGRFG